MIYIFSNRLLTCLMTLIFVSHLVSPTFAGPSIFEPTSSVFETNQIEFQQPHLFVKDIVINENKLPEHGDMVNVDLNIINEDNDSYIGFELMLEIEEIVIVQHGPTPHPDVYNKSLGIISAESTSAHTLSFLGNYGQYTLTAALTANGTILSNSVSVVTFQVINQPIGSLTTLIIALILLIVVLLAIIAIPSFLEKVKSKI
ncbi:MAG: hypothetical protein GPJ54_14535 [Candidatus Heimdallarchaeota archaeon]|nr:hypothetical protein [Candidatus Heimdallarchaeota archaeon]